MFERVLCIALFYRAHAVALVHEQTQQGFFVVLHVLRLGQTGLARFGVFQDKFSQGHGL